MADKKTPPKAPKIDMDEAMQQIKAIEADIKKVEFFGIDEDFDHAFIKLGEKTRRWKIRRLTPKALFDLMEKGEAFNALQEKYTMREMAELDYKKKELEITKLILEAGLIDEDQNRDLDFDQDLFNQSEITYPVLAEFAGVLYNFLKGNGQPEEARHLQMRSKLVTFQASIVSKMQKETIPSSN